MSWIFFIMPTGSYLIVMQLFHTSKGNKNDADFFSLSGFTLSWYVCTPGASRLSTSTVKKVAEHATPTDSHKSGMTRVK